jgi:tetratricopeptide (TPR) repeat protein
VIAAHQRSKILRFVSAVFLSGLLPDCTELALGHDSPATAISKLTAAMAREGVSAELFFRRGCEFRAIRHYKRAAYDLSQALELDSSMVAARLELARLQLENSANQNLADASNPLTGDPMKTVSSLVSHPDSATRTAAIALRGEILMSQRKWKEAIEDFSTALSLESNIAWFLWRSEAEIASEHYESAIAGLKEAYALTGSPVARKALCDVFIAAAKKNFSVDTCLEEASKIIQEELAENRLKSSWRIRAGEILLLRGDQKQASLELLDAIQELDDRLQTNHPDPALVQDLAKAKLLVDACTNPVRYNGVKP